MQVAVLGAGAWGTALAIQIARCHGVTLWTHEPAHAEQLQHERTNQAFLPGYVLPERVMVTSSPDQALDQADIVVLTVPTFALRGVARMFRQLGCTAPLLCASKGLEEKTAQFTWEIISAELPTGVGVGFASGPNFAHEVAQGLPTAITVASTEANVLDIATQAIHHGQLRVYSSADVIGVAVSGAVKNIMAIAAGISDGMHFGHNARAALITRGMAEITRLGLALGGSMKTFSGLAGIGDLVLTCAGDLSRNRTVGLRLAAGEKLAAIMQDLGHVAEGVTAARLVRARAQALGIEMPITQEVCRVLFEDKPPRQAVEDLLGRDQKAE